MTHPRHAFSAARVVGAPVMLFCAMFLVTRVASQEQKSPHPTSATRQVELSATDGRQAFESRCAGCHGLDGRGGERAPDVATSSKTQRRGDDDLVRIVERGMPETGMPSFSSLGRPGIANVVAYLRLLQGRTGAAKPPGDAEKGRALFHGKAGCSECHMVAGVGGFIGMDLSGFGGTRSVEDIRNAITKPSTVDRQGSKIVVATRDGRHYTGVARNEDNFSIQLQTLDGEFHLFLKSELGSFARQPDSLMPSDYGSTLNAGELNDLVSFLMRAAHEAKADAVPSEKRTDDEEEE